MQCPSCNTSLKEGGKFCEHCDETARSASRLAATMTVTGRWMGPRSRLLHRVIAASNL